LFSTSTSVSIVLVSKFTLRVKRTMVPAI